MKHISIFAIALMVVGSFVLSSCRGAIYTAPLVPRFSGAATAVTITVYTNAAVANKFKATGTYTITDALGDAGFVANIKDVTLYYISTNVGSTEGTTTVANDPNGASYYKVVKQADAKVSTATGLSLASVLQPAVANITLGTNSANLSYQKAIYSLTINAENGNSGYTLDDYSKLATTYTVSIGTTP